jgi:hypothetical protein
VWSPSLGVRALEWLPIILRYSEEAWPEIPRKKKKKQKRKKEEKK